MFIAALFIIAKTWKQLRCPSVGEWIKNCGTSKQWNIIQRLKRNELSSHEKTWRKCTPETYIILYINYTSIGTSLVVQWVRLHAPNAGSPGSIPGWGTRSCMHAATKKPACRN